MPPVATWIEESAEGPASLEEPIRKAFGKRSACLFRLGKYFSREDLGEGDDFQIDTAIRRTRPNLVSATSDKSFCELLRAIESDDRPQRRQGAEKFLKDALSTRYLQDHALHIAEEQLDLRDLRTAINAYDAYLAEHPHSADGYLGRGVAHTLQGHSERALSDFSKVLALNPTDSMALRQRGGIYSDFVGAPQKALADFEASLRIDPYSSEALVCRGVTRFRYREEYDAAIEDFQQALHYDPFLPFTHYNLGCTLLQAERYLEATPHFDFVIGRLPDYAEAWVNRGICHRALGRLPEAVSDLTRGHGLDSRLMKALWNRALAFAGLCQSEEAIRDLEDYLAADSKSPMAEAARKLLGELKEGELSR